MKPTSTAELSAELFSRAMARVPTPVAVVTTFDGSPHGTTVSAFASLSLNPPMVLVALDRQSQLLERLTRSGHFGINVLSHDQSDLAMRFARKGADSFDGVSWRNQSGCPGFEGAAVWLACGVAGLVDGGDHRVALGNVLRVDIGETEPLTYHARAFGRHAPLQLN